MKNEYGQFMKFEFLTFVPIDVDAVDKNLMTERDVELFNAYHKEVYEKISPYLEGDEKEWLKKVTAARFNTGGIEIWKHLPYFGAFCNVTV